jgi:hypothetical protein
MRLLLIRRTALILLSALLAATPASACLGGYGLQFNNIRQSDVVVVGKLIDYRVVSPRQDFPIADYAILTIQTERMLKGKRKRIIKFSWDNSTFNEPESMRLGTRVIVAGVAPLGLQPPMREGASATVFPAPRRDIPRVLQAPCTAPFIFGHSAQFEDSLVRILRGEDVPDIAYPRDATSPYN